MVRGYFLKAIEWRHEHQPFDGPEARDTAIPLPRLRPTQRGSR